MINLCLVVIATQFSETKKREMERMLEERQRFHSSGTLAGNPEVGGCYDEIIRYMAHIGRRVKRKFWLMYRQIAESNGLTTVSAHRRQKRKNCNYTKSVSTKKKQFDNDLSSTVRQLSEDLTQKHPSTDLMSIQGSMPTQRQPNDDPTQTHINNGLISTQQHMNDRTRTSLKQCTNYSTNCHSSRKVYQHVDTEVLETDFTGEMSNRGSDVLTSEPVIETISSQEALKDKEYGEVNVKNINSKTRGKHLLSANWRL